MRLGSIVANIFAALLLICALAIGCFIFGKPLWPEHRARMAIVLSPRTGRKTDVRPRKIMERIELAMRSP